MKTDPTDDIDIWFQGKHLPFKRLLYLFRVKCNTSVVCEVRQQNASLKIMSVYNLIHEK